MPILMMKKVNIKYTLTFLIWVLLTGCSQRVWQVQGQVAERNRTDVFSLHFNQHKQTATWVCYTEVSDFVLQAVSCQNDTALPLFSAGRNPESSGDEFLVSMVNKYLLMVSPQNTLAYLQIALYPKYKINSRSLDSDRLEVDKTPEKTYIYDHHKNLTVAIRPL